MTTRLPIPSSYRRLRYRDRWFCYIDLLGFTAQIGDETISKVISLYQNALREMQRICKPHRGDGVTHSWFSDTFIIYSYGSENEDFVRVEQTGRTFFEHLILNGMAARGAISFGKLYSQSSQNVFVGPVLIDAYRYGEGQNWVGFILAPSVRKRLRDSKEALVSLAHYRLVEEQGVMRHAPGTPVSAFVFNNQSRAPGLNPYVQALKNMRAKSPPAEHPKYDRAIRFATQHSDHDAG